MLNLSSAKTINADKVDALDIIIAIMGPSGAGKSNLIDKLIGQAGKRSGNSLQPQTDKVQATRVANEAQGQPGLVILDTPGFDETNKSDKEILNMIDKWLEKTHRKGVKLSGILYMHRITDNRMTGAAHKNLRMFEELCGDGAAQRVVLVTSMWDKNRLDRAVAEGREQELKRSFWKTMIDNGSTCARFLNTQNSANELVNLILMRNEERETLLLQEEIVEIRKQLNETKEGKTLYNTLQKLLSERKETVRMLSEQDEKQDNPHLKKQLDEELGRIQKDLHKTFEVAKPMKISWTRRFILFFSRKIFSLS